MVSCTLLVLVVCRQAAESCPEDCFLPPVQSGTEGRGHDQTRRPGQLLYLSAFFFCLPVSELYIYPWEGVGVAKRVISILSFLNLGGGGGG